MKNSGPGNRASPSLFGMPFSFGLPEQGHQAAQRGILAPQRPALLRLVPVVEAVPAFDAETALLDLFRQDAQRLPGAFQIFVKIAGNGVMDVESVDVALLQGAGERQPHSQAPFRDSVYVPGGSDAFFQ